VSWVQSWLDHHLGEPIVEDARYVPSFTKSGELVRGVKLCDYCGNWGLPLADAARRTSSATAASPKASG
jgi:hypothetical protein